jgi:biopolymer transport protein ExbD
MTREALKKAQASIEMDMTPMIDCVFLLMIFFVLVIDLSQKNLEDLILPKAIYIEPDDKPEDNRPILNVMQDGAVVWEKTVAYDPAVDGTNYTKIKQLLQDIKQKLGKNLIVKEEPIGGRMVKLVDNPILLRADKWTEWHYIGEIMKQCSQPEAAFWKLELALSEEDKELPRQRRTK